MTDASAIRSSTHIAALCVLVAALLVGGGAAVSAWSVTTHNSVGDICGSAWHFHPGSGRLGRAGEMSDAERVATSEQCDQDGAGPWRRGWLALVTGTAVAAVFSVVFALTRPRRRTEPDQPKVKE